ncbi:YraN family protein [Thiomicrospira sp. R3]|uniref:YraN family protein n=1 Tax=Thiomicrospira sp. R3 TaxID=3035472 RepID=UPI00259B2C2B|nr:YraN family protein [Thiomicrospira sp. R3]WFE67857.1 YraN family protein [Thiomicrospira sp. R3]
MNSKHIGQHHENQAKHYLSAQGLVILHQNFYCKGGEIDLIALDQNTLVFIEVKFRQTDSQGLPSEFITPTKQKRLVKCAQFFLLKHRQFEHYCMRFDSLSILGEDWTLDWQKNIINGW